MRNIWTAVVLSIFMPSVLMACTQGEPSPKLKPKPSTKVSSESVSDDGQNICGGSTPVYAEYPPLNAPFYNKKSSAVYSYELDDSVVRFSPHLAEWVVEQVQFSMNGFESQAKIAEISERTSTWTVTAIAHNVANVEHSLFTKSKRAPEGVTVKNTYLYNRGVETDFEIQDLFSDRKKAEVNLMELLADQLTELRSENLGNFVEGVDIQSDTLSKLPDGIFGYLDVELFKGENLTKFEGLKISISENPPWNWFPEGGYIVEISASDFSSQLKPKCKTLFLSTF